MSTVPQTTRNYSSGLQSGMSRLVLMNFSYVSLKKAPIVAGPRNQLCSMPDLLQGRQW